MDITTETRVLDLIRAYPYLKDWLTDYAPEFKKLGNPMLLATAGRVATLATAADMGGVPAAKLVEDIRAEVARRSGEGAGVTPVGGERRAEELKAIIRELHDGATVDAVKARFAAIAEEVDASEIAAMEQALIAEGMPPSEVQRLCDVHVEVFREVLEKPEAGTLPELPAGHPIDSYVRENRVLAGIVSEMRCELESLAGRKEDEQAVMERMRAPLNRLQDLDTHYTRKENQLFPLLERHGVSGPTKVMWGLQDDIRERIRATRRALDAGDAAGLVADLPETLGMIEDMVYKEERILFPVALEELTAEEWAEMARGEGDIGFAWIERPSGSVDAAAVSRPAEHPPEGLLPLTTGAVSLEQLDLVMRLLPVDVTYVDETGHVRYYSEGDRVFPRSPAIIGRRVQNCHPPKSVDIVMRIFDEFRYGSKDEAEFWIELQGRFVHIRYLAVRDDAGTFRGVLEVTQDATHVRSLEGERRLLDW